MHEETDVLVIGGGIAGIVSSIEAARAGANVTIACAGPLFGGSSFYPGTWGLGLIGPSDEEDEADLIATIETSAAALPIPPLSKRSFTTSAPQLNGLNRSSAFPSNAPPAPRARARSRSSPCSTTRIACGGA